ncbi:MAG: extracellular solute-binding protein [Caldilineaceae bacterium]
MKQDHNRLSRRQFLAGLAVVAGTSTLAACVAPAPGAAPAEGTGAGSAAAGSEAQLLSFMNWDEVAGSPFEVALNAFTDKTGIQVDLQPTPSQDYGTKLRTMLAGATAPDVFRVDDDDVRGFSLEGQFLDLQPFVEKAGMDLTNYYASIFDFPLQPEGDRTAWSIGNQPRVFFWNIDLFDAAGVPHPPTTWTKDGWNWDDFLAAAKALTIPDQQWGALISDNTGYEQTFLVTGGVPDGRFSFDGLEFTMASPKGIEIVQWVADLTCVHGVQPEWSVLQRSGAGDQLFVAGQLAMTFRAFGSTPYFQNNITDFAWDIAPVPGREDQQTEGSLIVFAVPKSTANADLAWELLNFMIAEEGGTIFAQTSAFVPAHKAAADKIEANGKPPEHIKLFLEAADHSTHVNFSSYTSRARSVYRPLMDLVWTCQDTAENVLSGVKAEVETVLAGN